MQAASEANVKQQRYQAHLKHLKLKNQPKSIEAYVPAIRRIGTYFYRRIDDLSEQ